ncbi:type II secretion system F family protein [Nakamurella endophytica]|uniref:Pilus assembly protein TadB n=1 Tax=Nakamurella endophytica TaxID=1748367 RepID=A0A917WJ03_9ACTN|nr:type II secretion system F family protein [Nakamurella endophytica]GGM07761.1 pilus assembly protein TadB [Nakamurella endophytica]
MNLAVVGGLLGAVAAAGVLLAVLAAPPLRRLSLGDRVAPYLGDTSAPSRLLAADAEAGRGGALARLTAPAVRDAVRFLDRLVGGQASVRRRLQTLDSPMTVEQFRAEQVVWGAAGAATGLGLGLLAVLFGQSNPVVVALLVLACTAGGVLGRDWWLSQAAARRDADVLSEFPVVAEMLALAVTAGEGPVGAIDRISRLARGHLVDQLASILADTRAGTPLLAALTALRDRTRLEPLARFLDGMAVAVERGTPLADVLRAQAADVRDLGKRRLLEAGGKKEIAMMVPVVFLVLPITILFALYPGLIAITTVAR